MQEAIVSIAVSVASVFIIWRYTPNSIRLRYRSWLMNTARRLRLHRLEQRLMASRAQDRMCSADSCGSCNGCTSRPSAPLNSITPSGLKNTIRR